MVDSKLLQSLLGCEVLHLTSAGVYIKAYVNNAFLNPVQDLIQLELINENNRVYYDLIPLTKAGSTQKTTMFYLTEDHDSLTTLASYLNSVLDDFENDHSKD